ncbi:MAG TPA: MFS transporter [Candidatus Nanoarchaeia archaeon]|nr:MFS transporter [Candidatus Nanoarchaeia archaeon]
MGAFEFYQEKGLQRKLFLPALVVSNFSVWLITVTNSLLLIEIANTFEVSVGTASLMVTVGSVTGIVTGILTSILSIRYEHKLLMISGLLATAMAGAGLYLAPTFGLLLLVNIGVGFGIAVTGSMAYSLVGEFYPLEKRGRAIGWLVAGAILASVVGAPVSAVIASIGTWRLVMLSFIFPIAVFSIALSIGAIPKPSDESQAVQAEPFLAGCRQTSSNPSAIATLLVGMFAMAESTIGFYLVSFFRTQFAISVEVGSLVVVVGNLLSAAGGVVGGTLVNRVGRKPLGLIAGFLAALLTLTFAFMPTFETSWGLNALRFWFAGMSFTAGGSLVIEQVPKFRGTVTSLNGAFVNAGMLLASITGGIALNLYSYQTIAVLLGSFGVIGTVIWILLVRDPCRIKA